MDVTAIAAAAVAALSPFLLKGAEKFAERAGEETFTKRGELWEQVKSVFSGDELVTLNLLEKYPENQDIQTEVVNKLEEKLEADPGLARNLEELLSQMPGTQIKQNTISQTGNDNVANQDISNSTINIKS